MGLAVAASLVIALLLGGVGFLAGDWRAEQQLALIEAQRQQALEQIASTLNSTLETNPSGQAARWRSDEGSFATTITPVRTFRSAERGYCREFTEEILMNGEQIIRRGISCRTGKKQWETQLITPSNRRTVF